MKKIFILLLILSSLNVRSFCQQLSNSGSGRAYITGMSVSDINTETNYSFTKAGIETPVTRDVSEDQSAGDIYNFRIYPNPLMYDFTLQLPASKLYNVSIIDTRGKSILDATDLHDQVRINMQEVPSGDYFVRIYDNSGVISKRIKKQ